MTLTIAFDTSSDFCSAAFVLDGKVLWECSKELSRGHAEKLVPMIKGLGRELGIEISDSDARKHVYGMSYDEWKKKYQK